MGIRRRSGSEKAGDVKYHAANAVPAGWLECNGATISRTTYAALFAAIGSTYGAGDGATTFKIPDLRGEFVRGWDNGRGVDAGRVFGAAQADEKKAHAHELNEVVVAAGSGAIVSNNAGSGTGRFVASSGGTETRPRNVAMTACIKYF